MNRIWLAVSFLLSTLLLSVHLYALRGFMYWYHRWLDIPMHIVGGAALGALFLAFTTKQRASTYFTVMLAAVVGWELFEYFAHISTGQSEYWLDTVKDIADGLIGSCIPYFISRRTTWR